MEEELKSLFHPDDVRVFNAKNLDDAGIMWKIGSSAAAYIDQEVHSNMRIGVTWGRTLNFMVNELTVNPSIKGLEVYSLIGGTSSSEALQPGVLAQNFLNKYNGSLRILAAPFICSSEKFMRGPPKGRADRQRVGGDEKPGPYAGGHWRGTRAG